MIIELTEKEFKDAVETLFVEKFKTIIPEKHTLGVVIRSYGAVEISILPENPEKEER